MFQEKIKNNRKTTKGRKNQYVEVKDSFGRPTGKKKLIRHSLQK